jgi:hypothetical protein
MAEEEAKKVEVEVTKDKEPDAAPAEAEPEAAKEDVAEEKAVIPATEPPADDSKALAIVESEYNLLCLINSASLCMEGLRMKGGAGVLVCLCFKFMC